MSSGLSDPINLPPMPAISIACVWAAATRSARLRSDWVHVAAGNTRATFPSTDPQRRNKLIISHSHIWYKHARPNAGFFTQPRYLSSLNSSLKTKQQTCFYHNPQETTHRQLDSTTLHSPQLNSLDDLFIPRRVGALQLPLPLLPPPQTPPLLPLHLPLLPPPPLLPSLPQILPHPHQHHLNHHLRLGASPFTHPLPPPLRPRLPPPLPVPPLPRHPHLPRAAPAQTRALQRPRFRNRLRPLGAPGYVGREIAVEGPESHYFHVFLEFHDDVYGAAF